MKSTNRETTAAMVIGLCSHGLAVARALEKEGISVYAVEKTNVLPGVRSNSVKHIFYINSFNSCDLISGLIDIRAKLSDINNVVLMPINDEHVRIVGEGWNSLKDYYLLSWSSCIANTLLLQKKNALEDICKRRGLNYPTSQTLNTLDDVAIVSNKMHYPLIVKPSRPMSSFKTEMAADHDDLHNIWANYSKDAPLLCQEYIDGGDEDIYFVELFFSRGKAAGCLVGRKLLSYPKARGQAMIAESFDYSPRELIELADKFFEGLELSGPLAIEFKQDPSGEYWVIEPTVGRTEFLVELVIGSGFNVPLYEFLFALGKQLPEFKAKRRAIWFDGEKSLMTVLRFIFSRPKYLFSNRKMLFPYFCLSDLLPFFAALLGLIKNIKFRF